MITLAPEKCIEIDRPDRENFLHRDISDRNAMLRHFLKFCMVHITHVHFIADCF